MAEPCQVVGVRLEWYEAAMAVPVGCRRQLSALRSGKAESHGRGDEAGWNDHAEGACGEVAVARTLGRYWDGSVDTYWRGGDVGPTIQVRTRSRHDYELYIRPTDPGDARFVLVTGRCPNYRVVGWCYAACARAHSAREAAARRDDWVRSYGGRPPAIFVPHSALRPISELMGVESPAPGLAAPRSNGTYAPTPMGLS